MYEAVLSKLCVVGINVIIWVTWTPHHHLMNLPILQARHVVSVAPVDQYAVVGALPLHTNHVQNFSLRQLTLYYTAQLRQLASIVTATNASEMHFTAS